MPLPPSTRRGCFYACRKPALVLLLSLLLSPAILFALKDGDQSYDPASQEELNGGPGEASPQKRPAPGGFFRRLRELPPDQQRRLMANNPQFQRMSPDRQELIRERLREWNAMSAQQKEIIREREEIFDGLTPAQRQEARTIFPQWRDLTPPRRQALMVAFRHLRDLPPGQRRAFLNSPRVREQFSPHERDILDGMNKLLPAARNRPSNNPDQ